MSLNALIPTLADCQFCQGPAELLEHGQEFEPSMHFAHQAMCAKCGIRGTPATAWSGARAQAIASWNTMQRQLAMGAKSASPAPAPERAPLSARLAAAGSPVKSRPRR